MKRRSLLFIIGASIFLSCSKDAEPETKIDANSLELNYDKTHQFEITKGSENLSGSYKWASSDPTVGTVSPTGKFTARKIGSTVVSAKSEGQEYLSYITVSPYSTMFKEPSFEFGQNRTTIKNNNIGTVEAESDNLLVYSVYAENVKRLLFAFENDNLTGVAVDIADTEQAKQEAKTFFRERYPNVLPITGTQDSLYINDGKNIGVKFNTNESLGYYATYGKVAFTNGRLSSDSGKFDAILRK
ncbi:Ig-like domain-containing protein [Dyadobacter sp. CY356]|uniref:Ig-like domain-containing protein n=1 Tax=Dyadobacter sp. CY356 TaxID=2906442 RepID=UPI001F31C58B|nr:Ig-like domain-containing protein [Dyadobacter sp. CY356]MCF0058607.1 Ig-like domain-containing protein [Dyadobacter sp. CY356]